MLKSKRFWVAVGAVLVVVLQEQLGISPEELQQAVIVAVGWIVGDSIRGA